MKKYSVIDLFAGAGGLSLGFMQTKKYEIKAAFENSPYMQETYRTNHPGTEVLGDVCNADYKTLKEKYGDIDIVIGGPPCQGFSNANRQKNHVISQNNMLVKQYIRAILELQPKAFVMENVSMLRSEVHRFYKTTADIGAVEKYGIPTKETPIILIEGKYSFDGAIEAVQSMKRITEHLWPEEDYSELNVAYKTSKNGKKLDRVMEKHKNRLKALRSRHSERSSCESIDRINNEAFDAIDLYYTGSTDPESFQNRIAPAVMVQRMLSRAKEIIDNDIVVNSYDCTDGIAAKIDSFAVLDYIQKILTADENGYAIKPRVLNAAEYGAPQKRMRFVVLGIKKSISEKIALPNGTFDEDQFRTVRDAIGDLESVPPVDDIADDHGVELKPVDRISVLGKSLRNAPVLRNHVITKTTPTAMERFVALKQGQNFHALSDSLKTNTYTDVGRTQNTIYLRLAYDEPCGTVVNVRKSMWVHPTLNRAVSVREAARLQTFPDSFVFCGSKDKQYQQVGNAVPPILAKAIAEKLASLLDKAEDK